MEDRDDDVVARLTPTRTVFAGRVAEVRTAPHLVVERDVRVDAVLAGQEQVTKVGLPAPSLSDVFVKAAALALREHPRVNASWHRGSVVEHERVDVGFTVAGPNSLSVPVVRNADRLPLASIAWVTSELARQARTGRLPATAMRDGTFTISNLGLLGVDAHVVTLEWPQAALLAIGAVREESGSNRQVRLRLTCDHRVLHDSDGQTFLDDLTRFVVAPLALAS